MAKRKNGRSHACEINPLLRPARLTLLITIQFLLFTPAESQEKQPKKLFAGDAKAVDKGRSLFRANCSYCHGYDAQGGGRGPDLTSGRWTQGESDGAIFRTITRGVPGTEMPANDLEEDETWMIVAFLRSLSTKPSARMAGVREAGEKIFFGKGSCARCHMVKGKGGRLGPDLSRIGASRSRGYLIEAIRDPGKNPAGGIIEPDKDFPFPLVYNMVTVITKNGQRITGVPKNEDTFTLQLMDGNEDLRFFLKTDLEEVIHERQSMMPAYRERMLSEKELQDLLAYLDSLRGQ